MWWMLAVEWSARLILGVLIGLSIWSVTIIVDRFRHFRSIPFDAEAERNSLKNTKSLGNGYYGVLLQDLSTFESSEQIEKAHSSIMTQKRKELEKGLPVLGTLGATAPFIGLLGTVLGIIVSFGELSKGAGSTNTVMFSLAEALILTAVGLLVAIPAVISFNIFSRKTKLVLNEAEGLKDLYIAYRKKN